MKQKKRKKRISILLALSLCFSGIWPSAGVLAATDSLIINQVYGNGGKSDPAISRSYVELYNPTDTPISLDGYRLVYSSSGDSSEGGTNGGTQELILDSSATIGAHSSYLVTANETAAAADGYTLAAGDQQWEDQIFNNDHIKMVLAKDNGLTIVDQVDTTSISKQKVFARENFGNFVVVEWKGNGGNSDFVEANRPHRSSDGAWGTSIMPDPIAKIAGSYNDTAAIEMEFIARYDSGTQNADGGAAEIVKYNPDNQKFYLVNGTSKKLEIVSLQDFSESADTAVSLEAETSLDIEALIADKIPGFVYGDMTSVDINPDLDIIAVAIQAAGTDDNGLIGLFGYDGTLIKLVGAGKQPDMVTFTPDGTKVLSADEGEPRDGYSSVDPKGSVTVVDLSNGAGQATSVTISFDQFDTKREELVQSGVILQKGCNPSRDFEPEYIAVSADSQTAYISLQEANAVATLNLATGEFEAVQSLGFKNHNLSENALDLLKDDRIELKSQDVYGIYMPDAIRCYEVNGTTYLVTANEGDSRDWTGFCNEKEILLDGCEVVTLDTSFYDGLDPDKTYLYGGRSFAIYEASTMTQVFESGSEFETITAEVLPDVFNCSNDKISMDNRSGKKGPEPEDVAIGTIGSRTYAFIGLERIGGIMMYDITNPYAAVFVNYINSRDYSSAIKGDVSPEGLCFIPANQSPTGQALLLAANEVSGTVAIYRLAETSALPAPDFQAVSAAISALPDTVKETDIDAVIQASLSYDALDAAGKQAVGSQLLLVLQRAQEQVRVLIQADPTVSVSGLPWYVKVEASSLSSTSASPDGSTPVSLFSVSLTDLLHGGDYAIPQGGLAASVVLPDLSGYQNPRVFQVQSGSSTWISSTVDNGRIQFTATAPFTFGIAAEKIVEGGNTSNPDQSVPPQENEGPSSENPVTGDFSLFFIPVAGAVCLLALGGMLIFAKRRKGQA